MFIDSFIIIVIPLAVAVMLVIAGTLYMRRTRRDFSLLLQLADSVNEVFWITDRRWKKIYYISPAFEKVWGRTREELYMSPQVWLESVHPDHRDSVAENLAEIATITEETRFPNYKIEVPGAGIRWIASRAFPIRDSKGKIIRVAGIAEDITRRIHAEEELSRSSKRYHEMIDNIQDVVYRSDLDGVLTMISPSVTKLLGYEREDECLGKNIAMDMYYNPDDRFRFMREMKGNGAVADYVVTLKKKDGSPVIVSTSSHYFYSPEGKPAGIEGIVRDITARKRAEELFNKAFMDNPTVMSVSDILTGNYVEINRAYTDVLGYTRDEVVGHSVYELNIYRNPEDRQRVVESMQKTGRAYNLEIEFLTKSGDIKTGLFFGEIIEIVGKKMLLSSVLNITDQRLAENAYRESEERFRRLAENAPDVIYRMKLPEGIYEYASPSVNTVLGCTQQQLYDNPKLVAQLIHPEWMDYFVRQWNNLLQGIVPPFYEYMIITPAGEEKWMHQRNMLITDTDGRPVALEGIVTDITERKKIEEEIRLKNLILATEQDVSIDGILVVDNDGRILLFNRRFREIWGIPGNILEMHSDELALKYVKNKLADPVEFITKVNYLYSHQDEKSHDEFYLVDGRIIDRYSAPMISSEGINFGRVWYFRDITERKQIEQILRGSEKKLLEAEKISQMGHWELHLDTNRIYGSAGARELYGLEAEFWDFKDIKAIALPEYRPALDNELREMLENGRPYDIEFKIRRLTDGMVIDIHSIAEYDRSKRIVFGTIQDISERKHTEDEVQKLKNYLANIIDSNPSILVGIDTDMNVTLLNRHAEKIINISSEAAVGMPLGRVIEDFTPWIDALRSDVISRSPAVIPDLLIEKNGERHFYNLMLYPLVANGIEGAVVRIDDITDSRRKEEQLIQAQKMETVGTLAGGLAHDFNNVLSGIIGTVSLMKHRLGRGDVAKDQIMNWVDTIEHSSARAADMVNRLLVLSSKHDLSLAPMDLNSAVKNVMEICTNSFDKSIKLSAVYGDGSAMIKGVPAQIEQVILNICVNASHAMTLMRPEADRKGGTLSLTIKRIRADRFFCTAHPEARPGSYWLVSHSDTGIGMDSSVMSKIYDPFFTTKEKGEGTGLGLAMVYNIVHQHNGFIDVYSERGVGSTFNVYLPEYLYKDSADQGIEEKHIVRGSGLILVIDDEEIVRLIAESILTECGYNVIMAEDGKTGIEIFRGMKDEISAVLLDIAMPGMSGDDVFIELKKIDPGVKVLLSSGFRQDSRVEKSMSRGVSGFIQKPYSIAEMSLKMQEVLEG